MKNLSEVQNLIREFYSFAKQRLGFKKPVRLFLKRDADNSQNLLGKTAYYDPQSMSITVYITDRHPKDVLRSFSHELVHHNQNCNGKFEMNGKFEEGYAQENPHLRNMEKQAYLEGNLAFRDWEDSRQTQGE